MAPTHILAVILAVVFMFTVSFCVMRDLLVIVDLPVQWVNPAWALSPGTDGSGHLTVSSTRFLITCVSPALPKPADNSSGVTGRTTLPKN